ncbi:MAG: hypothetical protein RL226_1326, partial [Bacteroidota bacterium]
MKSILFILFSFAFLSLFSQNGTVQGTVRDAKTGEIIIGANVLTDANTGVATDVSGSYSLALPIGDQTLVFSFIGYKTVEKKVSVKEGETTQ